MTPPSPPSVTAYFAKAAPVCVLLRSGPRRYTQMVLWHTDTDVFEPGQWTKGRVDQFSMTSDGKYAGISIMGAKSRVHNWSDVQISFVCRPPFFTALELLVGGLCFTVAAFLPGDRLKIQGPVHEIHAANECPFERAGPEEGWPPAHEHRIEARGGKPGTGSDQQGRPILIEMGRIFDVSSREPRLLFDFNAYAFENVVAPEWATRW